MIMTEKLELFASSRKNDSKPIMSTAQNILRDARLLKNVMISTKPESATSEAKVTDVMKGEKRETDSDAEGSEPHRSFSRAGNDLIETDDELVEVGSPERCGEDSEEECEENRYGSSRPLDFTTGRRMSDESSEGEEEYFRPLKRLAEQDPDSDKNTSTKKRGVRSFCIDDILSHKTKALQRVGPAQGQGMHRPWDQRDSPAAGQEQGSRNKASPLDALFNMISNNDALTAKSDMERQQMNFANKQPPKKKRKSRTAFTNHQIFELEKRFLYQKYLSPADRDEIAAQLGLSNAQVICWFQNRRAKYKRDLEELKKDVEKAPHEHARSLLDPRDPRRGPPTSMASMAGLGGLPPHLHHPLPLPHPLLLSMAPHLLPPALQRSPPMGSPEPPSSPPIRVEDSE